MSVETFLESIKRGYAQRFGGAFEEFGFEDVQDIAGILNDELHCKLTEGLIDLGAKPVQLARINKALGELCEIVEDEESETDGMEDVESSGCKKPQQKLESLLDEQQSAGQNPPNEAKLLNNLSVLSSKEAVQQADCVQKQRLFGSGGGDKRGTLGVVGDPG